MAITRSIKLLVEICGRCGDEVVNDNTGSGRPWLHLAGEPEDGHFPHFGIFLPREDVAAMCLRPDTTEADEEQEQAWVMPPPEVPGRPATEEEIGLSNRLGRRQIINFAKREGFTIDVRYSRGAIADQWGRLNRVTDSLGILGIHSDGRVFHAWWIEDSKGVLEFQNARCYGLVGFQQQNTLKRYITGTIEILAKVGPTR